MTVAQLQGPLPNVPTISRGKEKPVKQTTSLSVSGYSFEISNHTITNQNSIITLNHPKHCHLSHNPRRHFFSPTISSRKHVFPVVNSQSCSDYSAGPYSEESIGKEGDPVRTFGKGFSESMGVVTSWSNSRSVDREVLILALPAMMGQAVEPFSQLMETAFIGRLGPVELASAGVSVSIFNIISKIFNIPLLSVTTSFVAEDIAKYASSSSNSGDDAHNSQLLLGEMPERMLLPSVSTALLLAAGIGILEAAGLYFGSGILLNVMGLSLASPMRSPAQRFLALRALGAPAFVLSLAIQGIFRGFKDTRTPLLCLGVGNVSAVILLPLFMYSFQLGMTGAAIATVGSQYIVAFLLFWFLNKRAVLRPPRMEDLHFDGYVKSGGLLLGRTLAVLLTLTFGTSMAAQLGPIAMAGHQICMQVWLAVSLLSDALGAVGQVFSPLLARRLALILLSVLLCGFLSLF